MIADHLGGHLNRVHIDQGTLEYLVRHHGVASMIDIGCGPGWMSEVAHNLGVTWYGIDGDSDALGMKLGSVCHDFSKGPCRDFYDLPCDLAWSVEFLEHVEEKFLPNYMSSFRMCKHAVVTAAPPGYPGHHHVNCRSQEYWKGVFAASGFRFDPEATQKIRLASTMVKPFMQSTGMVFHKYDLV